MQKNHWNPFLPKRALVMARHRSNNSGSSNFGHGDPGPGNLPLSQTESPSATESTTQLEALNSKDQIQEVTPPSSNPLELLQQISSELQGCTRCKLCAKRQTIVIGEGNPHAELVFVGEGPGEQEDIQGRPFVGKAGQLLDRMIQAIGLQREQVYIANVVKCRPPGNRNPEPDEIATCSPFLYRQLNAIQPKIIIALGKFAAQTLLQSDVKITQIRGKFQPYQGKKLMPTFHPSYLLRNPSAKKEAWIDLQAVAKELGLEIPKR